MDRVARPMNPERRPLGESSRITIKGIPSEPSAPPPNRSPCLRPSLSGFQGKPGPSERVVLVTTGARRRPRTAAGMIQTVYDPWGRASTGRGWVGLGSRGASRGSSVDTVGGPVTTNRSICCDAATCPRSIQGLSCCRRDGSWADTSPDLHTESWNLGQGRALGTPAELFTARPRKSCYCCLRFVRRDHSVNDRKIQFDPCHQPSGDIVHV